MKSYEEVKKYVKEKLSEKRFYHSQCVEERCIELARIYGVDVEKARLIGIAHDVAKEMPFEEKIKYAEKNDVKLTQEELKNTQLLHAPIGAKICEIEFGFSKDMAEAVANHTTAKAGMDMLSKILFIGDSTSKDRKYEKSKELYELSLKDIDLAIFKNLCYIIEQCINEEKVLDLESVKARNEYLLK